MLIKRDPTCIQRLQQDELRKMAPELSEAMRKKLNLENTNDEIAIPEAIPSGNTENLLIPDETL